MPKAKIKTFEEACKALKIKPKDVLIEAHSKALEKDIKALNAFMKLTIIGRALNQGWEPDWGNINEWKYYPWMYYSPGVGFSFGGCAFGHAGSHVGSRLCFKTKELAEYAGKQFKDLYNDLFQL